MRDIKLNPAGKLIEKRLRIGIRFAEAIERGCLQKLSEPPNVTELDREIMDELIAAGQRKSAISQYLGQLLTGWYPEYVEKDKGQSDDR